MKISLNWLRELVTFDLSPEALAHALTMAGFEVEEIEDRRTWAKGVVVGHVLSREQHPNADKLSVCQVDIGAEKPLNIVCGAANVAAGLFVPVATVGTELPKISLKIRPSKLRGVTSEGMICSLAELGLSTKSEGIHSFNQPDLKLGSDVRPLLGLDDVVLDLSSTANRADALSMVGIAREVAALTNGQLKLPITPKLEIPTDAASSLRLQVEEPQACPAYIGTLIEGVKIGPSPEWLQRRLQAAGIRPISNVVDVTNYVLLEWGQPLHAFDADQLRRQDPITVGVRFAKSGETLTTLDSQKRDLQAANLVITDGDKPIALAGVMGGEESEVSEQTVNLVLEAALFDPVAVRRSARAQGLRSEASTRYERGVNFAELEMACARAIALITELAGGQATAQSIADARQILPRTIELRLDRVAQVLGPVEPTDGENANASEEDEFEGEIPPEQIERILTSLGFSVQRTEERVWTVGVPPYRYRDMEREIDLIEEIARLYGYDNFSDTLPAKSELGYLSVEQALLRRIREAFRAIGLTELIHYSLVSPNESEQSVQVQLSNPLLAEYSALRYELLDGLVGAFSYNLDQGNGPLNGFEVGRVFSRSEEGNSEAEHLAGILGGDNTVGTWQHQNRPLDWYSAKGLLESAFERLGLSVEYQPDRRDPRLHPGRTASLWISGERLGSFGQLHPQFRQERGLPDEVYAFELDLYVLMSAMDRRPVAIFKPYSTYPASDRDLALFAPLDLSVSELQRTISNAAGPLLESVSVFDEYRGEGVPTGRRSLAFRLVYRSSERTLTDQEVEPVHQNVREALVDKFNISLRS
ncbi:phenylalanine--tRNA ligase subunit beta [Leptolyngbya sp. FACHB-261]|uniref:phenylalanine--tRNA ligase subunit beta n=1 Tax=Leptolyngbya sp. FACHB-261 TaxID=2692806 RepID=UPI0016839764|nr:phenylalanine--tRNA ligase subunit beta [Leptolyngbya sp. FACHB-261]MBD2103540.1 phenylalanine--tRNA ligase subunit beta [Leptolyngbya sp. FACHB-261]